MPNPARATSQASGEEHETEREVIKHRTTRLLNHKRHPAKRGRRSSQTNLESISSRRLSESDPWHGTKHGQKRSLASVPVPNAA